MNFHRVLSTILSGVYIGVGIHNQDLKSIFLTAVCLIFPMACIWFAEEMGNFMGTVRFYPITSPSPRIVVLILGWVLLLFPFVFWLIQIAR